MAFIFAQRELNMISGKKQKGLGLLRKRDGYKKLPVFPSILQNTETCYFVLWNALYVSRLKCNYYDRNDDN